MPVETMQFGAWTPDIPDRINPGLVTATNVRPHASGYRKVPALATQSDALSAYCRGFISVRADDATAYSFAGNASSLYKLSGLTWTDVSKTSDASYSLTGNNYWEFANFGNLVIACNLDTATQVYDDLASFPSPDRFADLGGSPPKARHIAVSKSFVMLGYLDESGTVNPKKVRWCAFEDPTDWTAAPDSTQSDSNELLDGKGDIYKIVGGEYFTIFQERAIWRATYVGVPGVFQFEKVEHNRGTKASNSVVNIGSLIFYLDEDGFYVFDGSRSSNIGHEMVDKFFLDDVDTSYLHRISAAVDPVNKLIMWAYVSRDASAGFPDKVICFNYRDNRWSLISYGEDIEFVSTGQTVQISLDQLDALFGSIDDVTPDLDDPIWSGGFWEVAVFNSDHKLVYQRGDALAATLETGEKQFAPDVRTYVRSVTPLVDGGSASVAVGGRSTQSGTAAFSSAVAQNTTGRCPQRSNSRYHRFRVTTSAATEFNDMIGLDVEYEPGGRR